MANWFNLSRAQLDICLITIRELISGSLTSTRLAAIIADPLSPTRSEIPMAVRKTSTAAQTIEAGNPDVIAQYERSMNELEQIVARLEQGETTLEQSLADYERGALLARQCEQALKAAEQRIDALMQPEEESSRKNGKKDAPTTQPPLPPADAFFDV